MNLDILKNLRNRYIYDVQKSVKKDLKKIYISHFYYGIYTNKQ